MWQSDVLAAVGHKMLPPVRYARTAVCGLSRRLPRPEFVRCFASRYVPLSQIPLNRPHLCLTSCRWEEWPHSAVGPFSHINECQRARHILPPFRLRLPIVFVIDGAVYWFLIILEAIPNAQWNLEASSFIPRKRWSGSRFNGIKWQWREKMI